MYQSHFSPTNFTVYPPTGYQMTVPPQTFWQEQTINTWNTNNISQTQQLTNSANNSLTQSSLIGMKPDSIAPSSIKKQNNNNLIDLNFFDNIEKPKKNFASVRTSVLEAFDPLLHGQSTENSSDETDKGNFLF